MLPRAEILGEAVGAGELKSGNMWLALNEALLLAGGADRDGSSKGAGEQRTEVGKYVARRSSAVG